MTLAVACFRSVVSSGYLMFPPPVKLTFHHQAANLRGFRASMNPRFEGRISDFMNGIPDFMDNFNAF